MVGRNKKAAEKPDVGTKRGKSAVSPPTKEQREAGRKIREKGASVSGKTGAPTRVGTPFDSKRAAEAARRSAEARREKADLRRQLQIWMESDVGTGKDGEAISGSQMMVRVAVKEIAKGNPKFWELVRDTAGFKPVDKVMVAEVDPGVIDEVEKLVEECGHD